MIKYKAEIWHNEIDEVEVERETESSVWINGRRHAKQTSCACYFDTWDEALDYKLSKSQDEVERARSALERAKSKLGNIKGLKKPNLEN